MLEMVVTRVAGSNRGSPSELSSKWTQRQPRFSAAMTF